MLGAMMNLDSVVEKVLYLLVTVVLYPLTGRDFSDKAEHNDFEVLVGWSSGFFILASGTESIYPTAYSALHP